MSEDQPRTAYYAVIPADVRYDPNLKPNAKLLYGELTSLCNKTGYCWATNEYFSKLYELSIRTISRLISQLEESGYIRCEMVATEKGSERRIYAGAFVVSGGVDKNVKAPLDKNDNGGLDENVKQNNKQENNKQESNTPYNPPEGDGGAPPSGDPKPKRKRKQAEPYKPEWFESFWKLYPRKDGKKAAQKAWDKLRPTHEVCVLMVAALEQAKKSRDWLKEGGAYIPHASTWLNGERWKDEGIDLSQLPQEAQETVRGWVDDPEVIT